MSQSIRSGTIATFTVGDVVCPEAEQVLRQTGPELAVRGRVVYLSDSGERKNYFAIVEVDGIHAPLIVPVSRLRVKRAALADPATQVSEAVGGAQSDDGVGAPVAVRESWPIAGADGRVGGPAYESPDG